MVSQPRSRPPHYHQCMATGPRDSCSDSNCNTTRAAPSTSTLSSASTSVNNSSPTTSVSLESKPPCPSTSSVSVSSSSLFQSADITRARSEVQLADKEGIRYPSSGLSSTSRSSSHPNPNDYLETETEANPETEGDNAISRISIYVSDSESGLALAPVSAEEHLWGSSASANGTGGLPAHSRVSLALANTDTICTSASATTLPTSTFTASRAPSTTAASDMSTVSSDTSIAPIANGVSTMAEYERDAYHYHAAHTAVSASVPAQSQTTPAASSSTLRPMPTLARGEQSTDAPPQSSSRTEAKWDLDPCAESSTTSRLDAPSWNRNGAGVRSGTETPVALDTPAFRTPLGVYNGFVNGHRDDKEGYFPSSSSGSSVFSVISAASVQPQEGTKKQKRPQLRHFPSLARGISVPEKEPRPRQALSLLALPAELVAHILRMGYFSPPEPVKSSLNLKSSTSTSISGSSPRPCSIPSSFSSTASFPSSENDTLSTDDDAQHENEDSAEHELEQEDDNPPTITCDPHLRLALLHTCCALRAAVFADPALWSIVRIGPGDGEGGVRRALGASPFSHFFGVYEAKTKESDMASNTKGPNQTYLGHQLALARAHPLRISLTAFWGRSEIVEETEVDASEAVFGLLAREERAKQWEAFELVCPREDEWVLLARATACRAFPKLRYLSLTFVGRSSGSATPMPVSTSVSASRRQRAADAQREPRERRAREGRPGARHSVALPSGSFGGWHAGALPSLKGLLLRGVDLEGVVEDVLEHEYEPVHEPELDGDVLGDMFHLSAGANDPPEPALPALRALDIRGHGLWPEVDALDAFFARHVRGLRRLGVHVRSGDVLKDVVGLDADGSPPLSTSTSPLRIPNLRVLEVDTSEGLNRDTARMVRLLAGAAVYEGDGGLSEMRRVVVKESGGVEGEELLRWSCPPRPRLSTNNAAKPQARLAITNSAISSALSALPPAMLRRVGVLVLDVPAGEGGWGDARRLKEMLSVFGAEGGVGDHGGQPKNEADSIGLGRLRRMEVRNADVLGVVREVLAQPRISASQLHAEHEEEDEDEDEDDWQRTLSSTSMAEPLCTAQELVISFLDSCSGDKSQEDCRLHKATVAFVSLFGGTRSSESLSGQSASSSLISCPSIASSTYASLKRLVLKRPTHAQVAAVLRSFDGGSVECMAFDGPQIRVQDIRL
ncbi:hypothetical protein D9619_008609 [Psilocybe cf. subviscida]|uniref:Uncharacterized protein n=1 Tax=Psilocybe cf. subviscida TaxID=2480587 RepID=A0A8H5BAL5_9AGAR|nr:hypothetical protein D9619_008609 [Psilocybe cf. subviscida]